MRFICDVMLGKLSKYLRVLGLDTVCIEAMEDLSQYTSEKKLQFFLTKRGPHKVLYRNSIYIKSNRVIDQLIEIKDIILPHISATTLMNRCIRCNTVLNDVKKADIEGLVPEFIFHKHDVFKACPSCNKVYWEGSHVAHINKWVKKITELTGGIGGR